MESANKLVPRYFLTFHFENGFIPATTDGMIDRLELMFSDIAILARKSGYNLHAIYSIVKGLSGYHVHAIVNWLPTFSKIHSYVSKSPVWIKSNDIVEILIENYFYVDNKKKAIQAIKTTPSKVKEYLQQQSKGTQSVIHEGSYISNPVEPEHSNENKPSYYSKSTLLYFPNISIFRPLVGKLSPYFIFHLSLLLISWYLQTMIE